MKTKTIFIFSAVVAVAALLVIRRSANRAGVSMAGATGYGYPYIPQAEALPGGGAAWFEYKPFTMVPKK